MTHSPSAGTPRPDRPTPANPGSETTRPATNDAKTTSTELLLEVRDLSKSYGGVQALSHLSIRVAKGELIAIVGDNGAGKSTLVKILSGAIQPDAGQILIEGRFHRFHGPAAAREAGIETVYQDLALIDGLDVASNLFLGREIRRGKLGVFSILASRRMARQARDLLAGTGVKVPNLRTPVRGLSGGQRQGVAIARAAGWGTRLIVMDEPTAALGVQETQHVEEIIRGLRAAGVGVIVVSHNIRQVFALADTILVLRRGKLAGVRRRRETTPEEVVGLITGADLATG